MANQNEWDDENDQEDSSNRQNGSKNDNPGDLRKALKVAKKENERLVKDLAQIQTEFRSRSVKDVLESKGVPAKVANFIPADVTTSDQITAWLTENSDVFGFQLNDAESGADDETRNQNISNVQRINAAVQNATSPTRDADLLSKINNAKTKDELDAVMNGGAVPAGRRWR